MLRNMVDRQYKTTISYELTFDDGENNGYAFPCDSTGKLDDSLHECAIANYHECLKHPEKYVRFNKVVTVKRRIVEPAHGTCICGREVYLYDQYWGACACECGRWYNLFGQELLPPEQWEHDPAIEEPEQSSDYYYDLYNDYD